jgi:hypothetical protein
MSLKALADAVIARNQSRNSPAIDEKSTRNYPRNSPQKVAQLERNPLTIYCAACRHLRMSEVRIPGIGGRFIWGCAKGHMEHGHSTPALGGLTAPDSCLQAKDYL